MTASGRLAGSLSATCLAMSAYFSGFERRSTSCTDVTGSLRRPAM